jgi:hypothetical protein
MKWGKKKDEVSKQRAKREQVPYRTCGKQRTYRQPNGTPTTVYCQKNANIPHKCD